MFTFRQMILEKFSNLFSRVSTSLALSRVALSPYFQFEGKGDNGHELADFQIWISHSVSADTLIVLGFLAFFSAFLLSPFITHRIVTLSHSYFHFPAFSFSLPQHAKRHSFCSAITGFLAIGSLKKLFWVFQDTFWMTVWFMLLTT